MPGRITLAQLSEMDLLSEDSEEDPEYDPNDESEASECSDYDDEEDIAEHRALARNLDRAYADWFETNYEALESVYQDQLALGRTMFGNAWAQHLRLSQWARFMWQHTN